MAKATLATNFKDDILNSSMGNKRRYNLIQNDDGTVSLEDASTYDQVGSEYGAGQVNATNKAVNESADAGKIIDDVDDISAVTEEGYIAGALALKQVNNSLNNINISVNDEGELVFTDSTGADTVIPFSSLQIVSDSLPSSSFVLNTWIPVTLGFKPKMLHVHIWARPSDSSTVSYLYDFVYDGKHAYLDARYGKITETGFELYITQQSIINAKKIVYIACG